MSRERSDPPLDGAQIAELFATANSLCPDTSEHDRIEAVGRLLREFHLQIEQYQRKERTEIDRLLERGIADWGLKIFAQKDPLLALAKFLGKKQRRGKRAKNAERDRSITAAVLSKIREGSTLETATEAVAPEYRLEPDTIKKIYTMHHVEVKADLAMKAWEKQDFSSSEN